MAVLFMFFLVIFSIIFACCTGLFSKDDSASFTPYNPIHMESREFYNEVDKLANSVYDCKKTSTAIEKLEELELLYDRIDNRSTAEKYKTYLKEEISDAKEEVYDRVFGDWKEKADEILNCFMGYYDAVINNCGSFQSIEFASADKNKCLKYWDKYWSLHSDLPLKVSHSDYMREYLQGDYEPCMQDRWSLEKRLADAIDELKPERKRKQQLYSNMLHFVGENGSIKRAVLLKHSFLGFNSEEVKYCYNELLKKYRLVEYRIGNPYFVMLSDKEREKYKASSPKEATSYSGIDSNDRDNKKQRKQRHLKKRQIKQAIFQLRELSHISEATVSIFPTRVKPADVFG